MAVKKIVVLASGGGSNLQSLIDAAENGAINARIAAVISDRRGAFALERAKSAGIPSYEHDRFDKARFAVRDDFDRAVADSIDAHAPDLIVLAGYLSILPRETVTRYRVINIHPSLLPKFGGMGFYGRKVHEAVIAAGETESGATVHYVDEGVDTGGIIAQERVPVMPGDTAETLAARVLETEHNLIVTAVKMLL